MNKLPLKDILAAVDMGGKEILGIYLKRFFPKLLHKVVLQSAAKK